MAGGAGELVTKITGNFSFEQRFSNQLKLANPTRSDFREKGKRKSNKKHLTFTHAFTFAVGDVTIGLSVCVRS